MAISRHILRISLPVIASIITSACSSDRPDGIPSPDKMEEVLYDYHLAKTIDTSEGMPIPPEEGKKMVMNYYVKSALAKHGMTEADFDRSLRWYTRHSEILYKIYSNLDKRSGDRGGTNAAAHPAPGSIPDGDTLNIWQGLPATLLSTSGTNRYSFSQPADTSLRKGDRIIFSCNALWAYREGSKSGVMQLSVHFAGDSVASTTHHFYANGVQEAVLFVGDAPIKSISGFIYQIADWSERPKLLSLTNLSLLRVRGTGAPANAPRPLPDQPADTLKPALLPEHRLRDSLHNEERLAKRRSHFEPLDIKPGKKKINESR